MRGLSKKMLISILTSVIVFVTMVATTFAWVGIFTYASTDAFNLNLKVQELDSNYFLTISSTGKSDSFTNEVPLIDIQRQVVNDKYNNRYIDSSSDVIEKLYNSITVAPVTTNIIDNKFSTFTEVNYNAGAFFLEESKDYYKFDIYLSVNTKEGITSDTTGIKANVLLEDYEKFIVGTKCEERFIDNNPFTEMPSNSDYDILKTIPRSFNVNSKNSIRCGFELYDPIPIDQEYENEKPVLSKIYQGGNNLPSFDSFNDTYDLGGCIPLEFNTAAQELLVLRPGYNSGESAIKFNNSLSDAINRGDISLTKDTSLLWNRNDHSSYLGCMNGIQTKMKISVYIWYEGWDADCLKAIELMPATVNLTFTSGIDD